MRVAVHGLKADRLFYAFAQPVQPAETACRKALQVLKPKHRVVGASVAVSESPPGD